jgi:hypothetical protein
MTVPAARVMAHEDGYAPEPDNPIVRRGQGLLIRKRRIKGIEAGSSRLPSGGGPGKGEWTRLGGLPPPSYPSPWTPTPHPHPHTRHANPALPVSQKSPSPRRHAPPLGGDSTHTLGWAGGGQNARHLSRDGRVIGGGEAKPPYSPLSAYCPRPLGRSGTPDMRRWPSHVLM